MLWVGQGVDEVQPDWNMKGQFWSTVVQPALAEDGLQSSHPISVPVKVRAVITPYTCSCKGKNSHHTLYLFL